jgi:hypothetical protein
LSQAAVDKCTPLDSDGYPTGKSDPSQCSRDASQDNQCSSGGGQSGGTTGGSFSGSCCVNGAFYSCPSQSAVDQCTPLDSDGYPTGKSDPSQCSRDASKDNTCGSK